MSGCGCEPKLQKPRFPVVQRSLLEIKRRVCLFSYFRYGGYFVQLVIEPKVLNMLGKLFATELYSQPKKSSISRFAVHDYIPCSELVHVYNTPSFFITFSFHSPFLHLSIPFLSCRKIYLPTSCYLSFLLLFIF